MHSIGEKSRAIARPLRVLLLEDRASDARLLVQALRREGFDPDWRRVETEPEFLAMLDDGLDLILADYSLPQFDAPRALKLLRQRDLDVPVIIVSGSIGEETAAAAIKDGAADYLLKDRLARLGPAVRQVLRQRDLFQQRLRNEQQLRIQASALAAAANGIMITDRSGCILWVNPAFSTMTGYSAEEVLYENPRMLKSGEHEPSHYEQLWRTILAGEVWSGEMVNRRKDGSFYIEEQTITPVRDARGEISHFISIKQDVTRRKQAEEADLENELRFRAIFNQTFEFVGLLSREGRILEVNQPALDFRGLEMSQVADCLLWETPWMDISPTTREQAQRAVASAAAGRFVREEITVFDVDGHLRIFDFSVKPVVGDTGTVDLLVVEARDITDQKRLEEQFRQAQKMEAVGKLAGGIAHDFNNLLTIITGYSDAILDELRQGDPLREYAGEIGSAASRAATLTRQLLAFSRKQVLAPVVLDLNALIGDMETMLRRLIGEDIDLMFLPAAGLWPIRVDAGQMEQVIMNLVINARDAMPQGGKVTIETDNVRLDADYAASHAEASAGEHVLLAVSDTGCGMDRATLSQIFEPFFTTKGPDKGTGLGLSTVHGIVKQSDGHIEVYSEPGCGTALKVYIPRDVDTLPASPAADVSAPGKRGTETVLLVEDEDGVRTLARRVLARSGYKVLEARHGGEALLICERHQGDIDILATDVVMPNMSGRELADRLALLRPAMKVLFLSGYTDDAIFRHGLLEAGVPFLQKPYSPDALAQKVREVLDRN